ncbi:hypothetical protein LO763_11715 [Glycomyces sp. A-F 0318]|uniref:hypothetical protein n=1 Tax=Glycomyces amatae TaxID=2881355 RepID=UPI001E57B57F|nr:hypothetical protein [Glycomyces amatae]MCD0444289.1 hypothetical protein [Glycomyces amatae]
MEPTTTDNNTGPSRSDTGAPPAAAEYNEASVATCERLTHPEGYEHLRLTLLAMAETNQNGVFGIYDTGTATQIVALPEFTAHAAAELARPVDFTTIMQAIAPLAGAVATNVAATGLCGLVIGRHFPAKDGAPQAWAVEAVVDDQHYTVWWHPNRPKCWPIVARIPFNEHTVDLREAFGAVFAALGALPPGRREVAAPDADWAPTGADAAAVIDHLRRFLTEVREGLTDRLVAVTAAELRLGDAFLNPYDPIDRLTAIPEGKVKVATEIGHGFTFASDEAVAVYRPADPDEVILACGCTWARRCGPDCEDLRLRMEENTVEALAGVALQLWAALLASGVCTNPHAR